MKPFLALTLAVVWPAVAEQAEAASTTATRGLAFLREHSDRQAGDASAEHGDVDAPCCR
jgi:hypothetical protein